MAGRGLGGGCEPPPPSGAATPLAEALTWAMQRPPLSRYSGMHVVELGLGRRFAYVVSEDGCLGLAYAWGDEPLPSWLLDKEYTLMELASMAWSHPALTSIALAAANAAMCSLIEADPGVVSFGADVLELLGSVEGSRVALVGYVPGVARGLRGRGAAVVVYEDNPMHRREAEEAGYPTRPGPQLLLEASSYDYVVATGSSLVTPTLYKAVAGADVRAALVGPTSSFHPASAARLGFSVVGGSFVPRENRGRVVALVKLGMGFRKLRGLVHKWAAEARQP